MIFCFIYSQVIEIHEYYFDIDMEETKAFSVSKDKCKANIKVFHLGEKFKDTREDFMLPDNLLDLQKYHK